MMETELTEQSEPKSDLTINQFRKDIILSKYAKIQSDEELFIDPNDIKLGESSEKMITGTIETMEFSGPISIEAKKYFYKKIGNCFTFFGDRKGDPLLILGPNWIKLLLILIATSIFFFYFSHMKWNNLGGLMKFIGIMIYILYVLSHLYTEFINPGYPKHNLDSKTGEPRTKYYYCQICKMWVSKEKKTKHCEKCDICVEGHINHYKWMSKCVGKNNHIPYYFVLISFAFIVLFILCIFATKNNQIPINALQQ